MNGKKRSDKDLLHLGLPPMELAESSTNVSEQNNESNMKKIMYPLLPRVVAILILLLIALGSYITLVTTLQFIENKHTTEIILFTRIRDSQNVTGEKNDLEIVFQLLNDTHPASNRRKRHISSPSDSTRSQQKENREILSNEKMQKAREVVMNHDVICNHENEYEICKEIVTKLKAITENTDEEKGKGQELQDSEISKVTNEIKHKQDTITSTEKTKRETVPFNQVTSRSMPNVQFEGQYSHIHEHGKPTQYQPSQMPSPLSETCLLARLLRNNYPNLQGLYDAPDSVSGHLLSHYENNPYPYSGYISPTIPSPYLHSRIAEPYRRPVHPQDAEIFMKFLTEAKQRPESVQHVCNSTSRGVECPREADCPVGTLSCDNGDGCINEKQWCDGNVDCNDISDELRCSCKSRVDKSRICDGYFDCPFGEDEMGCFGCSESAFSCGDVNMNSQSTCFLKDQRCNNVAECPNQRDEMECTMLTPSLHEKPLFAVSNTEGFLHRNYKGNWYPVCKNPYMWAHDVCRREAGLIIRPPFIQLVQIDPMLKLSYLNTGSGALHMSNSCFNSSAVYVTCPDLLCGTRVPTTSQLLRKNAAVENHLFGRNKRFLLKGQPHPLMFNGNRIRRFTRDVANVNRNLAKIPLGFYEKSKYNDNRQRRAESRVVGGRPSKPTAWPWMVAMYRNGMFHCGGVILTQTWIMSAAHCVSEFWEHYYEVQVGMLRRFSFSPQEQNHRVTHIIVNQNYNQADMKNDLSLLRVTPAIIFSRWVRPICLPGSETAGLDWKWGPAPGTICTAVGWGATVEHGPDPDHLREVELPIWAQCKHKEDKAGKEICAGPVEGGKDACQGDSGGPLLCRNPLNSEQWYMAGIVSHGDGCARKGEPGVYTRVSIFVKWIRYHIFSKILPTVQPKQECPGFKCLSGISKCIPSKRMCDKIVDCLDAEDEHNCNSMRSSHTLLEKFNAKLKDAKHNTKEAEVTNPIVTKMTTNSEYINTAQTGTTNNLEFSTDDHNRNGSALKQTYAETLGTMSTYTDKSVSQAEADENVKLEENLPADKFPTNFRQSTNTNTVTTTENYVTADIERHDNSKPNNEDSTSKMKSDLRTAASVVKQNSINPEIDYSQASMVEILHSRSSESSETINGSEENATADPNKSTTSEELEQTSRGDTHTFTDTSSRESLESKSSIKNTKEADIDEDWTNSESEVPTGNSPTERLPIGNKNEKEQRFETSTDNQNHNLTELDSTQEDEKNPQLSTIVNNTSKPESKHLLMDIVPDLTLSSLINDELHTQSVEDQETFDNSNLDTSQDMEGKNELINKIKDIVLSELYAPKMKKKHRIPAVFECRRILQTIPYHQRCNHKADCEDGTDELSCTCTDYLHTYDEKLLCDGTFDCADGQDEIDCYTCPEEQFLCKRSELCLPMKYVCDGKPQCPQGEDELDCYALSNGKNIMYEGDGRPKVNLEGYLTKKHAKDWQIVCEDNLSIDQQHQAAEHICRYLGFSTANQFVVEYVNLKDDDILKSSVNDKRNRRDIKEVPVHFAYRTVEEDDTARHIVIKEPQVLKKQCVPNVTKTCMTLYVFCDHSLYTNFDVSQELFYTREADDSADMWPWVAKIYAEGQYKCSGVLISLSWVLVNLSCFRDLISIDYVTVVLGSPRTLRSTNGMYEQIHEVDGKIDYYQSKVILLHLKESANYSSMVKPMVLPLSNLEETKSTSCVAIGQNERNSTVGIFLQETNENCDLNSRCFERLRQKENICAPGSTSPNKWSGIISCHSDQGWYPAASFVDAGGECGASDRIVGTEIGNLKIKMKKYVGSNSSKTIADDACPGQRCGRGQCVALVQVCDGVNDCHDGKDEMEAACAKKQRICSKDAYHKGCECSYGQFKCHNGKCVAKEAFNDGINDCGVGDDTDEPLFMSCGHYLSRVNPSRLCDGILHCKDRTDEDPMYCKCFAKRTHKCRSTTEVDHCVAPDMVCDGVRDCPEGDDETTCTGLRSPIGTEYGTGQVMVRSHGVWHYKCYAKQNHTRSELERICRELGFISGHAKQLDPPSNATFFGHNNVVLDPFTEVILNVNSRIHIRNNNDPIAKVIIDNLLENCHPLYIECR